MVKAVKKLSDFFFSLRTAIWLLLSLIILLLFGSIMMPLREEFQSMSMVPLFQWIAGNPAGITWWLWAAIGVLSLLTANTLLCSVESVLKKRKARHWLLVLSPQIIHIGFLFILLAHLLSSYGSFKGMTFVSQGSMLQLPNGLTVVFKDVNANVDRAGYVEDWSADVSYFRGSTEIASDVIRPNRPSFEGGLGIYIKTVRMEPFPSAIIEVSREPGAPWALAGGILFIAGMATLLVLKTRMDEAA